MVKTDFSTPNVTGSDAVTGLGVENRKVTVNTDYLYNTGINPLYLMDADTKVKLWINRKPGSSQYFRPVAHTRNKDSEVQLMFEMDLDALIVLCLREVIKKKTIFLSDIARKGGRGVQPEFKSFELVMCRISLTLPQL